MRKRLSCLLLSGALALGLVACIPGGDAPSPDQTPSRPVETESASRPVETAQPSAALGLPPELSELPAAEPDLSELPDREYQPWQTAYMGLLTGLRRAEQGNLDAFFEHGPYFDFSEERPDGEAGYAGLAVDERGCYVEGMDGIMPLTHVMEMGSETYSLYDVDRNGVPELFVSYDGWYTQCYTYRGGQVVCIGEFVTKDCGLYTHPEKDAVLCHGGRMGYYEVYEYPMEEGRLTEGQMIFSEGPVDTWTEAEEIVPGAEPIPYFYTWLGDWQRSYASYAPESEYLVDDEIHASAGKALLLPICDYYDGPAVTGDSTERARAAILAALNGEQEVYGASGDHFDGDIGPAVWEEYVRILTDVPNARTTAEITTHVWLDMNGDGQEECLLRLKSVTERGKETWSGEELVILSVQDGTVFAYCADPYDREFCTDGTIQSSWRRTALSFWQDQCYEYAVGPDSAAPAVQWLDGAPKG